jgi:hypothetical protein
MGSSVLAVGAPWRHISFADVVKFGIPGATARQIALLSLDPPHRWLKVHFSPSLTVAVFRVDQPLCVVGRALDSQPVFSRWVVSEPTPI